MVANKQLVPPKGDRHPLLSPPWPAEIVLLITFAVLIPLFETPKAILAAVIITAWLTRFCFLERNFGPLEPLDWAGIARAGAIIVSALYSLYLFGDWGRLGNINHDLLLVAFFVLMPRAGYDDRTARMILAAAVVGSVVALASLQLWPDHPSVQDMAILALRNANVTAFYLALTSTIVLAFLVEGLRARRWALVVVLMIVLTAHYAGIAFTGSRAGAIMALVGMVVVLPLGFGWRRALPALVIVALIAVVATLSFESHLVARLSRGFGSNFLTHRDEMWACGWAAFLGSPLLGYGPENLALVSTELLATGGGCSLVTDNSHNLLLNVMVDTGLIGAAAFIWLIVVVIQRLRAVRMNDGRSFAVWVSGVAGLCQVAVGGLVDEVVSSEPNLVLGLMVGLAITKSPIQNSLRPALPQEPRV